MHHRTRLMAPGGPKPALMRLSAALSLMGAKELVPGYVSKEQGSRVPV